MRKIYSIFILLLVVFSLIIGCAGSPARLSMMDKEDLSKVSDENLIRAISSKHYRNELLFEEVKERGLFTSNELSLIRDRKISRGMSEDALIASWGEPADINRSVGNYGIHKQYVYIGQIHMNYSEKIYVYVKNGKVTGWQD